jgi:hypothetical protein
MKMIYNALMMLSLFALPAATFAADGDVHEKQVGVSDVYVPSNFDSRSEAFVVVNGFFPHSCYKLTEAKVAHVRDNVHEIRLYAEVTEGLCLTVIVPFHKEIQIGKLSVGEHTLRFLSEDGTRMEKKVTIER